MGLFDKLLKEGADILKEVATDENKEKAASLLNSLKTTLEEHADELKDLAGNLTVENRSEEDYAKDYASAENDGRSCKEKILETLANEFPSCNVKEDVSPTEFGGTGRFMNYSLVVYENDAPKLIIMLIGKTTTAHREYRFSREFAESKGYPFINFVVHYPNTPEYIVQRLHKYL